MASRRLTVWTRILSEGKHQMASGGKGKRTEERIPVGGAMAYIHKEGYNVVNWSRHGIMIGPYVGSLSVRPEMS